MIEVPFISIDLVRAGIQNFTIIATLLLLYRFIPDALILRSKVAFSLCVGAIFGLAAVISIPALWQAPGGPDIGLNVVLVPLAGFIGGPVSAALVAGTLIVGSVVSSGSLSLTGTLTIMSGILLGALFWAARSWKQFPASYEVQLLLLGIGVTIIEIGSSILSLAPPSGSPQPGIFLLVTLVPFFAISIGVTVILGSIIRFIDRKRQAEKELLDAKNTLEDQVNERTAELMEANSMLKATIESTADGIIVTDKDDIIRMYNRRAAQILKLPKYPDQNGTGTCSDRIAASLSDPAGFRLLIASLPDSAEQIVTTDLKFTSGSIFELYVHPQQMGDRIVGRVWSLHDITEQRRAEEAIAAANNKLVLLSTITRHDVFNQIMALSGYLELLDESNRDQTAAAYIGSMKKSLDVIRDQLEFTRDYQDLGLKKPGWEDAGSAFRKAADSFGGRNVTFRCETSGAIFADPMIERVFYNLIENSLRHGKHISEIRLSEEKEGQDLLLVYEDNGVGVPPEEKDKIFIKGFGKHTGLGMFLVREILSITGITIRETGIWQQGARFVMRVPAGRFRLL
jgi:signal transduction histidine kinase